MPRRDLGDSLRSAARTLRGAGVASPENDALVLAALVLGIDVAEVQRRAIIGEHTIQHADYRDVVEQRAQRVPLQHITGVAPFRGVELVVGPGVFIPRPETEGVVDLALAELRRRAADDVGGARRVVDLCSGSGAIPIALLDERGDLPLEAHAVESSPPALEWLRVNAQALAPQLHVHAGDATGVPPGLAGLVGTVDIVTANPPYVPDDAVPVDPEVAEYDPPVALYGGSADGLRIPLGVAAAAHELLRPGGLLLMEHAEAQGDALPRRLREQGWGEVTDHRDATGRPRVSAARRA